MKRARNRNILTKEDYEKFQYHDTRFYGLFYKKDESGVLNVKIDSKRLKSTSNIITKDMDSVIVHRKTHYFRPKVSERSDFACNNFADTIAELRDFWNNHYQELIAAAIKKLESQAQTPGTNEHFTMGIIDYDEAIIENEIVNVINEKRYYEQCHSMIACLYAQFIHHMASQLEAVTVKVLTAHNAITDHFDRNVFYASANGKPRKVTELPSFRYYDTLYCLWNFIKHNSISTYQKLNAQYPEVIDNSIEYKQGMSANKVIRFSNELIEELLDGCDAFFKEYCSMVYNEDFSEAQWNYGRFFLDAVNEQIDLIINPLGLMF